MTFSVIISSLINLVSGSTTCLDLDCLQFCLVRPSSYMPIWRNVRLGLGTYDGYYQRDLVRLDRNLRRSVGCQSMAKLFHLQPLFLSVGYCSSLYHYGKIKDFYAIRKKLFVTKMCELWRTSNILIHFSRLQLFSALESHSI